jgi:hypothetical protein
MRNRTITAVLLAGMSWLVGSPQLVIAAQDAGDGVVESLLHVQRLPDGGLQPEAVDDADGVLHMLYFSGDPEAGDLFYRRGRAGSNADSGDWTEAVRVNSTPGSTVAVSSDNGRSFAAEERANPVEAGACDGIPSDEPVRGTPPPIPAAVGPYKTFRRHFGIHSR